MKGMYITTCIGILGCRGLWRCNWTKGKTGKEKNEE